MPLHEIIILAILQSLTEFLPISSSAHLLIYGEIFSSQKTPLALNVALHGGSTAALLCYFRHTWRDFIKEGLHNPAASGLYPLAIASIPIAVVGFLTQNFVEAKLHASYITIAPLAAGGLLLWGVDKKAHTHTNLASISYKQAIVIGTGQLLALIPGMSRSGITITFARAVGLNRQDSVKFAILLGTPVLLGAFLLKITAVIQLMSDPKYLLGMLISGIASFWVIKLLLHFVDRISFSYFAIYRLLLAAIITAMLL